MVGFIFENRQLILIWCFTFPEAPSGDLYRRFREGQDYLRGPQNVRVAFLFDRCIDGIREVLWNWTQRYDRR